MADVMEASAGGIEELVAQIRRAPGKVLARLRNALGTKDVEQSVELVQVDPEAARLARRILALGAEQSATAIPPMSTPEPTTSRRSAKGGAVSF